MEKKLKIISKYKGWTGKVGPPISQIQVRQTFYPKPVASVIREVGDEKDKDNISHVRKAMVGSGMALNLNRQWEMWKLFSPLQTIVQKYSESFYGTPVVGSLKLDGLVTRFE